ncbi:hypothetical protein Sjap_008311 [Stephania japonica]|uniref:Uncharacterized protein n=1 Tax=Stephania japonica TaxID=461633 RepID=A0AAP0JRM4_9MAGN
MGGRSRQRWLGSRAQSAREAVGAWDLGVRVRGRGFKRKGEATMRCQSSGDGSRRNTHSGDGSGRKTHNEDSSERKTHSEDRCSGI